jgi:hypothetical protein
MKLKPKNRLRLEKQTVRTLIEDDLAKAHGGVGSVDCRTSDFPSNGPNSCAVCLG